MSSLTDLLQVKWQDGLCPIINGVVFSNGRVVLLEFKHERMNGEREVHLRKCGEKSLESVLDGDCSFFTGITELCSVECEGSDKRLVGGEGGMGGDGFVALTSGRGDHLEWIAFFENSNPFIRLACQDGSALAQSTYGDRWSFPITNPEKATVQGVDADRPRVNASADDLVT